MPHQCVLWGDKVCKPLEATPLDAASSGTHILSPCSVKHGTVMTAGFSSKFAGVFITKYESQTYTQHQCGRVLKQKLGKHIHSINVEGL